MQIPNATNQTSPKNVKVVEPWIAQLLHSPQIANGNMHRHLGFTQKIDNKSKRITTPPQNI
jgi:hypothetical protein